MNAKQMAINRIYNDGDSWMVGKEGISQIELTAHGSEKTTIYKVTYEDASILFVGLLEHEVVREQRQANIFDYL